MNDLLPNRRFLVLMSVPFLVFVMARLVILASLESMNVPYPRFVAPSQKPVHAVRPARSRTAAAPVKVAVESNALQMNSILREYHYVFSGQVLCGGTACEKDIQVRIDSDHSSESQMIRTAADGTFTAEIVFKEFARRPLDWKITAAIPDAPSVEMHGRVILSEDPYLSTERTLNLP